MKFVNDASKRAECQVKAIAYLHDIWLLIEQGRPVQPNPFYERNALLTPEVVANVINYIEGLFKSELAKYRSYHETANKITTGEKLVPPGFDKLPYAQQLAVVQGIDRIFQEYRGADPPKKEIEE